MVADNGPGLKPTLPGEQHRDDKRPSKGIEMLRNKVETLNQLYDLDLTFTLRNAAPTDPNPHGTRVIVSFDMEKAIKAQNKGPALDKPSA